MSVICAESTTKPRWSKPSVSPAQYSSQRSTILGRSSNGMKRPRESCPHQRATAMNTSCDSPTGSAPFSRSTTAVLAWVYGWKRSSCTEMTAWIVARLSRYCMMKRCKGLHSIDSGRTMPMRPPSLSRSRQRSMKRICGGYESATLSVFS